MQITKQLYWRPEQVAKLMQRNKINDRKELASFIEMPYSTVCENLSVDWSGRVKTLPVLVNMCRIFNVNLGRIVIEPREQT